MLESLRRDARGFESRDGFALTKLTPAKKRKITKAFETIKALKAKPHKVVAPKSARAQRAIQSKVSPEIGLKLKRVYVPVADARTAKVKVKRSGEVEIVQRGLRSRDVEFNVKALLKDPAAEIERALKGVKGNKFHILAGDRLAHNFDILDRGALQQMITGFMNDYGKNRGEHAVAGWLKGVRVYDGTLAQFRRAAAEYRAENDERKALRRLAKRRGNSRRARIKGRL